MSNIFGFGKSLIQKGSGLVLGRDAGTGGGHGEATENFRDRTEVFRLLREQKQLAREREVGHINNKRKLLYYQLSDDASLHFDHTGRTLDQTSRVVQITHTSGSSNLSMSAIAVDTSPSSPVYLSRLSDGTLYLKQQQHQHHESTTTDNLSNAFRRVFGYHQHDDVPTPTTVGINATLRDVHSTAFDINELEALITIPPRPPGPYRGPHDGGCAEDDSDKDYQCDGTPGASPSSALSSRLPDTFCPACGRTFTPNTCVRSSCTLCSVIQCQHCMCWILTVEEILEAFDPTSPTASTNAAMSIPVASGRESGTSPSSVSSPQLGYGSGSGPDDDDTHRVFARVCADCFRWAVWPERRARTEALLEEEGVLAVLYRMYVELETEVRDKCNTLSQLMDEVEAGMLNTPPSQKKIPRPKSQAPTWETALTQSALSLTVSFKSYESFLVNKILKPSFLLISTKRSERLMAMIGTEAKRRLEKRVRTIRKLHKRLKLCQCPSSSLEDVAGKDNNKKKKSAIPSLSDIDSIPQQQQQQRKQQRIQRQPQPRSRHHERPPQNNPQPQSQHQTHEPKPRSPTPSQSSQSHYREEHLHSPLTVSLADPEILTCHPVILSPDGGDEMVLSGRRFAKGCVVYIAQTECSHIRFDASDKSLTCVTPPMRPGVYSVEVRDPVSQRSGYLLDIVRYICLDLISPSSSPPRSNQQRQRQHSLPATHLHQCMQQQPRTSTASIPSINVHLHATSGVDGCGHGHKHRYLARARAGVCVWRVFVSGPYVRVCVRVSVPDLLVCTRDCVCVCGRRGLSVGAWVCGRAVCVLPARGCVFGRYSSSILVGVMVATEVVAGAVVLEVTTRMEASRVVAGGNGGSDVSPVRDRSDVLMYV